MDEDERFWMPFAADEIERHLELHRRTLLDIRKFYAADLNDSNFATELDKLLNKLENRHRMALPKGEKNV